MTTTEARYIPHAEADAYREAGWDVAEMPMPHGYYSMLATRAVGAFTPIGVAADSVIASVLRKMQEPAK
jgi:hypothetical protein